MLRCSWCILKMSYQGKTISKLSFLSWQFKMSWGYLAPAGKKGADQTTLPAIVCSLCYISRKIFHCKGYIFNIYQVSCCLCIYYITINLVDKIENSRPEVFCKKAFLEISQNSQENSLSFLIKLQASEKYCTKRKALCWG